MHAEASQFAGGVGRDAFDAANGFVEVGASAGHIIDGFDQSFEEIEYFRTVLFREISGVRPGGGVVAILVGDDDLVDAQGVIVKIEIANV